MNYSIHTVEFRKYFEHWRDLKSFTDRMFLEAYKNYDMYRANKIIHIEIFNGLGISLHLRYSYGYDCQEMRQRLHKQGSTNI